jgi:hypothetical protein
MREKDTRGLGVGADSGIPGHWRNCDCRARARGRRVILAATRRGQQPELEIRQAPVQGRIGIDRHLT